MRIYLAAPFRGEVERGRIDRVYDLLRSTVWPGTTFAPEVYLPHLFMVLKPGATASHQYKVFDENTRQITASTILLAILDVRDSGTVWEMGYAYKKIPVWGLYVEETTRLSVMLRHGCTEVFNGLRGLEYYLTIGHTLKTDIRETE